MANVTYQHRKENHECVACGTKLDEEYRYYTCAECLAKSRALDHRMNQMVLKNGLCNKCYHNKALPGRTRCAECIAKASDKRKQRYNNLKAQGICVSCGRNPRLETRVLCGDCFFKIPKSKGDNK